MSSGSDSDSNSTASGYDNVAAMEQAVLPPMSEYELLRHNNILLNNTKLKELILNLIQSRSANKHQTTEKLVIGTQKLKRRLLLPTLKMILMTILNQNGIIRH